MTGIDRQLLSRVHERETATFLSRTPKSRALVERARASMPDGVPMGWMAGLYPHGPVYVTSGEGCRFEDVDGNSYLDMNQADLSTTCGFAPEPVVAAVRRRMAAGPSFLLPTEDAVVVAELLGGRYGLPCWQFTLSASGANAEAVRVARLATRRDAVLMFDGRYHGHGDEFLGDSTRTEERVDYVGLAADAGRRAHNVPFNDVAAVGEALASGRYACLVAEPALTNCGVVPPVVGFWPAVRELCEHHGTLLILDETHTQTFAWGGLGKAWALQPDMLTIGKCLGGGIPVGAYGMRADLGERMRSVLDHHRGGAVLPTGGTLYGNALSMAAARVVLEEVLTEEAYQRVDQLGRRLAQGLEAAFVRHGLDWCAPRLGGRSGWCMAPRAPRDASEAAASLDYPLLDARWTWMANRGVWDAIASAGPACSFAHQAADVDRYLALTDEFLRVVVSQRGSVTDPG